VTVCKGDEMVWLSDSAFRETHKLLGRIVDTGLPLRLLDETKKHIPMLCGRSGPRASDFERIRILLFSDIEAMDSHFHLHQKFSETRQDRGVIARKNKDVRNQEILDSLPHP